MSRRQKKSKKFSKLREKKSVTHFFSFLNRVTHLIGQSNDKSKALIGHYQCVT